MPCEDVSKGVVREYRSCMQVETLITHVEVKYWHIDVIEQFGMVFDGIAARKEHDNLLLEIALEEGEEKHETLI